MTSKGSTLAQVQAEWEDDRAEDSLQDYLDAQNREMDAAKYVLFCDVYSA